MQLKEINHPLVQHKLTHLRNKNTESYVFRGLVSELVTLLSYEATDHIAVEPIQIETPVAPMTGTNIAFPRPIIVPILRAGLGMLEGMMKVLPSAEVGFLGIKRDEDTLEPYTYANRLPDDVSGRQCLVIDPMLATGGTLIDSINYLYERGGRDITAVCILAAPEGIKAVEDEFAPLENAAGDAKLTLKLVVGAVDEKLNDQGYIVPGLGDAGDRIYGLYE
jgi:uracil phosphoribosyltransferase